MIRKRKNPRTSRYKESLYRMALQFEDFEDFSNFYWNGFAQGIYWIGTNKPDYDISSPLEKTYAREGKVVAYISPERIKQKYAVEVDLSGIDPYADISENSKSPTDSIKILRTNVARILNEYTVKKAIEVYKYNVRYLPSTKFELKEFWEYAQNRHKEELEGKKRKTRRKPGRPKKKA